ncbi:hypothetical protein LY28_02476 [Ruminiclostridium sufflavum DSM 19573]|uniref:Alternate signal-mediated exported protein n=1 Tax=Ruminiclostridium sufflavum DSM 19573 TaxID=1121337 RepID=A0A318XL36_9FIRM|nr:hypothetical protein [Ruminiclostridium sufflavum]PYG87093.1 hypothetical protein LY28_02476 [Ruminiclostridium sufflavum DSM 19573]
MKKTIIMSALILTILTSIVAGTFATYTKTLSPITGNVSAKSFYIGTKQTVFPDIKLAPSEKSEWAFEVVNFKDDGTVNEVDTDMTIQLNVAPKAGKQAIDGLHVSIYDESNKQLGTTVIKNGQMTFTVEKAFVANTRTTQRLKLVADWKNSFVGDNVDTANAENSNATAISVTITGTQNLRK